MRLAEFRAEVTEAEHLTGDQVQEIAETFVAYYHTEEKEQAWEVGNKLYWHFKPLIKDLLFGRRNKMNVDKTVWTSTIEREGAEDMLSEGKVQFFELLTEYDPSSGVQFGVYIKRKLEFGIFNYLRDNSSFDNAIQTQDSLDELLKDNFSEVDSIDTEARKLLMRYMNDNSQDIDLEILGDVPMNNKHLALRVAWNSLNERQKKAVDLIINREYTLREAGAEMGIDHTTAREIKNTALKKMEKIINKILKK